MNKRGSLIVCSGPSGVGKGTLLRPLLARYPGLAMSVSATTRQPRPGERDGVDYFFVTPEAFEGMIEAGELLEYARYNRHCYGTPRRFVEQMLDQGRDVVLEIDVQGAMKVRLTCPDAVFVFILPPSMEELEKRLQLRGTETEEEMAGRVAAAREEILWAEKYDYMVINDDVQQATERLAAIITAAGCRVCRQRCIIDRQFQMETL